MKETRGQGLEIQNSGKKTRGTSQHLLFILFYILIGRFLQVLVLLPEFHSSIDIDLYFP